MRSRCTNPKVRSYKSHGARGIKVCKRWAKFENFIADMGPRPSPKHSLDRFPNNEGDYEPGNCRWATASEQQSNTRRTHRITANGRTMTLTEWSEWSGIALSTLWRRIVVWKWTPEKAVSKPVEKKRAELCTKMRRLGYPSVAAFLRWNNLSPVPLYNYFYGGSISPEMRARVEEALNRRR